MSLSSRFVSAAAAAATKRAHPLRTLPAGAPSVSAARRLTTIAWSSQQQHATSSSSDSEPTAATAGAASPQVRPAHLVMSVAGKDASGIVNKVTSTVASQDANVEESRMAILGGDFAMILYLRAPSDADADTIRARLVDQLPGFSISVRQTSPPDTPAPDAAQQQQQQQQQQDAASRVWTFSLEGPDQPGILAAVSQALAINGCNVLEMQTETAPTPFAGGELFKMDALVGLDEARMEQLADALAILENRFGTTIVLTQK